ncbi:hypothetical protein GIB67_027365 [Kingdonia uniflora]|uniref:Uncharacterized protein n=1 Tax=Kingdonia uniflora TaxID=39325 RepID=A0A7J7MFI8_9MAGN|nr:hypothetical protein GIB67_027365 [Kingdonia uniflora]
MVEEHNRLGCHLMLKGYYEEEVNAIKADTYIEEEDDKGMEELAVGVVDGRITRLSSDPLSNNGENCASITSIFMDDRSKLCSLKIFVIKALVKSYLPIKDSHLRLGFANLLEILKNVLAFGEISNDMESSPVDRAHMRLASAKAKKKSAKPSSVVRVDVWAKAHTKANGETSNEEVTKNLVKIEELKKSLPLNSTPPPLKDDMLSQVLGPERQGRVITLRFGVTPTRL